MKLFAIGTILFYIFMFWFIWKTYKEDIKSFCSSESFILFCIMSIALICEWINIYIKMSRNVGIDTFSEKIVAFFVVLPFAYSIIGSLGTSIIIIPLYFAGYNENNSNTKILYWTTFVIFIIGLNHCGGVFND